MRTTAWKVFTDPSMAVAVTETVLGVFPAFSSTIPVTSKVSVPVLTERLRAPKY